MNSNGLGKAKFHKKGDFIEAEVMG